MNNLAPVDLNRLDILITDDDNRQARDNLRYFTDVTLVFRQKPNNEGYKQFQGQKQTPPRNLDPNNPYYQQVNP